MSCVYYANRQALLRAACGGMPGFMRSDVALTIRTLIGDLGTAMCGWIRQALSSEPLVSLLPIDARNEFIRSTVEYTESASAAGKRPPHNLPSRQDIKKQIKLLADSI